MRRPSSCSGLLIALVALAALALSGCDDSREENNPFGGIDHNYRHVGQVDPIPGNGR
jgi:hypothetical protein